MELHIHHPHQFHMGPIQVSRVVLASHIHGFQCKHDMEHEQLRAQFEQKKHPTAMHILEHNLCHRYVIWKWAYSQDSQDHEVAISLCSHFPVEPNWT